MTTTQYLADVALIERYNPGEVLLPTLRAGHSRANEMYLRAALKRVPDPAMGAPDDPEEPDWKGQTPYADETLRALWRERTRLFGEMNRQSNRFHDCKTDEQRAENSRLVLGWWADILSAKAKIAYYEQHGELPPVAEEGDELPDNPVALSKKVASLRARISQTKKKLTDLAGLDPGTPGLQSKIDAAENDLKQLRFQAGKAEEKLKGYESAT